MIFFSFPFKNEELLQKWKDSVPFKREITKYSYVCSEHFLASDYEKRGLNIYLKRTAVPSFVRHNETQVTIVVYLNIRPINNDFFLHF